MSCIHEEHYFCLVSVELQAVFTHPGNHAGHAVCKVGFGGVGFIS